MSRLIPMLCYEDAPAAIEFLRKAFGFEESMVMEGEDGTIGHAELTHGDIKISLATVWREGGFSTPEELGGVSSQLWVWVDDVDAHFERAREAGAVVVGEPVDQEYGYRTYRAIDPEGHRWYFASELQS